MSKTQKYQDVNNDFSRLLSPCVKLVKMQSLHEWRVFAEKLYMRKPMFGKNNDSNIQFCALKKKRKISCQKLKNNLLLFNT